MTYTETSVIRGIKFLLDHKLIDINQANSKGNTLLHNMCLRIDNPINLNMLMFLITRDEVDINLQNKEGDTPLHIAYKTHNKECINLLLNHSKINKNIINHKNKKVNEL